MGVLQVRDPSLSDVLIESRRDTMLSTNCHAIATIQEFDAATQTVKATLNYKRVVVVNQPDGTFADKLVDYPILVDVPVVVISGGDASLTMPIAKGDQALICFNDRDIDDWFAGANGKEPPSDRLHSFSDGIAIIGLFPSGKSITSYDATKAVLRNGTSKFSVGPKFKMANDTKDLLTILNNLVTVLTTLTTTNAVVGAPCAVSAASITQLNTVATDLAGLLE